MPFFENMVFLKTSVLAENIIIPGENLLFRQKTLFSPRIIVQVLVRELIFLVQIWQNYVHNKFSDSFLDMDALLPEDEEQDAGPHHTPLPLLLFLLH